jgi:hypothetical protein
MRLSTRIDGREAALSDATDGRDCRYSDRGIGSTEYLQSYSGSVNFRLCSGGEEKAARQLAGNYRSAVIAKWF